MAQSISLADPVRFLSAVPFFRSLQPDELPRFTEEMTLCEFKPGENLLVQGQAVTAVFLIEDGVVDILVNEDRVAQRGRLESIGEMSCLSGDINASATVRAVTHGRAWRIGRTAFLQGVDRIPALRAQMFAILTGRLQKISHRFSEVLKHVSHGLVKIDLQGIITDEYSSRCSEYLGLAQLTGKNLGELLFADDPPLKKRWHTLIRAFLDDKAENVGSSINRLPTDITYRHPNGGRRHFNLFYHLSVDLNGELSGLDIGIEDVSLRRQYQTEMEAYQNLLSQLEQLLILFDASSGLILQETFSRTQLGRTHFPAWKKLKGKSILQAVLYGQDPEKIKHLKQWLKVLENPFTMRSMTSEELVQLAPSFVFRTATGAAVELTFTVHPDESARRTEIFGRFVFVEGPQPSLAVAAGFSTIELMKEVADAEGVHGSALSEALNEMQISIEIARSQAASAAALAENRRRLTRIIHSVKGLGQSFRLETVAKAAHGVEDTLQQVTASGENPVVAERLTAALESLLSLVVISKSLCGVDKVADTGECRLREPEIRLRLSRYRQLQDRLDRLLASLPAELSVDAAVLLRDFRRDFETLDLKPLNAVFTRLAAIIEDSASVLDKRIDFIIDENIEAHLSLQAEYALSTALIQLVKNAVFHGVETISERSFLQKPESGRIRLVIDRGEQQLTIALQDDGRGLNRKKIVERALQLNLVDAPTADKLLDCTESNEVYELLFLTGFSSTGSVSLFSGRGVGMELIRSEVQTLGGSITLDAVEGAGTRIQLSLPIDGKQIRVSVKPSSSGAVRAI